MRKGSEGAALRIYLDHNATTPLRDEVVDAMAEALRSRFGNPSSVHAEGASARACIERARAQVAALMGAGPDRLFFTSGASEANNWLLAGAWSHQDDLRQLVVTTIEHPSVLAPADSFGAGGGRLQRVAVDADGRLDLAALDAALAGGPALVAVIWANNETGVVQPVAEIAERVHAAGGWLHVDATQALGKWPVDVERAQADSLACSAHKLNGPKGVGALYLHPRRSLPAWLQGGPQERGRRGGTENSAGIVGFGVACELAAREARERAQRDAALCERLWRGLSERLGPVRRNGPAAPAERLPNTLNVEIVGAPGDVVLQALDVEGVAASSGAACHSGSISPSHVLVAMGRSPEQARASLRFSVGHGIRETDIDRALEILAEVVPRARAMQAA